MVKDKLESCVIYFYNEYELIKLNKKIHKIIKNNFFIQNELTNQKKLIKIPNRKNYFYLCENTFELNITNIDEYNREIVTKQDNTLLLEFEDCKLIYFKTYLKNLDHPKKYLLTIIDSYKHLLNSIQLLVTNNIFFNQINFDSIIVNNFGYPVLSNFSFSIHFSRNDFNNYIKNFIIEYDPSYLEWPIELHILSFLITNKFKSLSSFNIETIIAENINNNNILNSFGPSVVSLYKQEAIDYYKKYVNQSYEYILSDIIQYAPTWDNYALSILFLRILIGLHKTIGIKNKFIILFMKLLVCNIHLNPLKRLSINLTINRFNILIDSLNPKDFKDVIDRLRH